MSDFISTLKPFLQDAWKKAAFETPTMIQTKTIPMILEKQDVIAQSPTGTGKTLAYLLPLLTNIDVEKKHVQAVVLASSHELVMQIHGEIQTWAQGSGIVSASFIGGANMKRQLEKLKKRPQIIAGTPGRVQELIKAKKLKMHEVKTIVIDEGDQLLVPEHLNTVDHIIKSTLNDRQLLLFSATLPEHTEKLAKEMMKDAAVVQVSTDELPTPKVDHIYFVCELRDKVDLVRRLAKMDEFRGLGFVKGIETLSAFEQKLKYEDVSLGVLHSETKKDDRKKALRAFRDGKYPLLLATDVAARGLDIKGLTHVVHVDMPQDIDQYIHRSGRTGRAGASGTVISVVTEREERELKQYARQLNVPLQRKTLYLGQIVDEQERKELRATEKQNQKRKSVKRR
ncbi:DEAD/DEAH box helicase [Metabacillus iocasae]|uniref:Superfamily II DNA/RNA helicase n=1 Tax=Priestia iocasae TaxID=2291674 RepID=A0ABS2R0L9_9BACI|nr:DEAD/DEAH box helicase [Metabacillus iocasae]MBM7704284.1 superfamily II DNA/RNA helicase [Metabacillus iocasae]